MHIRTDVFHFLCFSVAYGQQDGSRFWTNSDDVLHAPFFVVVSALPSIRGLLHAVR